MVTAAPVRLLVGLIALAATHRAAAGRRHERVAAARSSSAPALAAALPLSRMSPKSAQNNPQRSGCRTRARRGQIAARAATCARPRCRARWSALVVARTGDRRWRPASGTADGRAASTHWAMRARRRSRGDVAHAGGERRAADRLLVGPLALGGGHRGGRHRTAQGGWNFAPSALQLELVAAESRRTASSGFAPSQAGIDLVQDAHRRRPSSAASPGRRRADLLRRRHAARRRSAGAARRARPGARRWRCSCARGARARWRSPRADFGLQGGAPLSR